VLLLKSVVLGHFEYRLTDFLAFVNPKMGQDVKCVGKAVRAIAVVITMAMAVEIEVQKSRG
jgi:hypothetical protein